LLAGWPLGGGSKTKLLGVKKYSKSINFGISLDKRPLLKVKLKQKMARYGFWNKDSSASMEKNVANAKRPNDVIMSDSRH